jgi:uncharacterized membrane protein YcaP (DUF421 family)
MDIVVRATVVFLALFLITRTIGRRELSMNEPFDLILLVVLGDLVQQGVTQADTSVTGTLLAVATFSLLTVGLSMLSFRVSALRSTLEGHPLILVEDGRPLERNLKRQRLALEEVLAEARSSQVTRLEDIQWAILETNGTINVIPKQR